MIIDGFGCESEKLKDFGKVYDFLNRLSGDMGMNKITQPYVIRWKDKESQTEGLTGFVIIAESHLAIHTFPDELRAYADVFSCRPYNTEIAEKSFYKTFEPKKMQTRIVRKENGISGIINDNGGKKCL